MLGALLLKRVLNLIKQLPKIVKIFLLILLEYEILILMTLYRNHILFSHASFFQQKNMPTILPIACQRVPQLL